MLPCMIFEIELAFFRIYLDNIANNVLLFPLLLIKIANLTAFFKAL